MEDSLKKGASMKKYATATAFRKALEERLKKYASEHSVDFQRVYRQVAFDRLLSRIFHKASPYLLKGGYAMELRMHVARATKDVDLALPNAKLLDKIDSDVNQAILEHLQDLGQLDLNDYFSFLITGPIQDLDAAPYGGARFHAEARVDGRTFAKFHLDVGIGDKNSGEVEWLKSENWLDFAGFEIAKFPSISKEQQFSEKIHAYTLPRIQGENSRVKDLVDMVLLVESQEMRANKVVEAVVGTFKRRNTHEIPVTLSSPPQTWEATFSALANDCQLNKDMTAAFQLISQYWQHLNFKKIEK